MSRTYQITDILEWDICRSEIAADCSHTGENYSIALGEAEEMCAELRMNGGEGLPFVCEAEDEEDALAQYNEQFYCGEYVQAAKAEIEEL